MTNWVPGYLMVTRQNRDTVEGYQGTGGDKVQVIYEPGLTYSRDKNMAGVAKAAAAAARADVIWRL